MSYQTTLQSVWHEFNKRLNQFGPVYVAGGAARDTYNDLKPKDYDVFVLCGAEKYTEIATALKEIKGTMPVYTTETKYSKGAKSFYPVASILWHGLTVQVMQRDEPDVHALLATFDFNICMYAYANGKYEFYTKPAPISKGMPLVVANVHSPLHTLKRGFRFSERFGMVFRDEDIVKLCDMILGKAPAYTYHADESYHLIPGDTLQVTVGAGGAGGTGAIVAAETEWSDALTIPVDHTLVMNKPYESSTFWVDEAKNVFNEAVAKQKLQAVQDAALAQDTSYQKNLADMKALVKAMKGLPIDAGGYAGGSTPST